MISSRTIKPVDDVRLATGEGLLKTRGIVTFSTVKMVTVEINGGLQESSYHGEIENVVQRRRERMDMNSKSIVEKYQMRRKSREIYWTDDD